MRPLLLALALLAAALPAIAADAGRPSVVAPYRFSPPDNRVTSPLDSEKARNYQDQLRNQFRLEQNQNISRDATGAAQHRETRRELNRMDSVLLDRALPGAAEAPALPFPGEQQRGPLGDLGPVVRSGGHAQPTPAEIKEREAARAKRGRPAQPAPAATAPVYDLYGDRLQ